MSSDSSTDELRVVGIALGANLGDPKTQLSAAREQLAALHEGDASRFLASPLFETDPVDCPPDSPVFVNAVVELQTALSAEDILKKTQALEAAAGRPEKRDQNAPRPLDLDLLYLGDLIMKEERLTLPHPRLTERRFVLEPLASIRPALILPGQTTSVADLLTALDSDEPALRTMATDW